MKKKIKLITAGTAMFLLMVFTSGFTKKMGGDVYRIFINDKLVIEQYLTLPDVNKNLTINRSNINDQFIIHYSHCGFAGKNRAIILKDEKGKLIKQWRFADAKGTGMRIAVKDVLNAAGGKKVSVLYKSNELNKELILTLLNYSEA